MKPAAWIAVSLFGLRIVQPADAQVATVENPSDNAVVVPLSALLQGGMLDQAVTSTIVVPPRSGRVALHLGRVRSQLAHIFGEPPEHQKVDPRISSGVPRPEKQD
jgi:hypothetical protein